MEEVLQILQALKHGQELLIAKIDSLEVGQAKISGELKEINNVQQRHERILEVLALKSVETDSYIKDFKERL